MKTKQNVLASTIGTIGLAAMTIPGSAQVSQVKNVEAPAAVQPFHFEAQNEALDDLRRRVQATKWPNQETVSDESQGVQLATMKKLAQYWAAGYDWRKIEAKLAALPQFTMNIDGVDIHFIHVRSKEPNALPVIITHGWPGSIIEQLKIIGPLTDPTAYGGKAECI